MGGDVLYNLAVRMSFTSAGLSAGITMAMGLFNKVKNEAANAEKAVARLQTRINGLTPGTAAWNKAQGQMFAQQMTLAQSQQKWAQVQKGGMLVAGGAVLTGAGMLGLDFLKSGVQSAMDMETAMNNVSIATDRASGSMQSLLTTAIKTSGVTRFSAVDVMNMAQLAASNGLNNRTALNATLPLLVKGAEVAQVERGVSYQDSIPAFVQLAHTFGQYGVNSKGQATPASIKAFNAMIDTAARSLLVSGGTPDELVHTIQYLKPVMSIYGGKNFNMQDAIQVSALAENLGLAHGRGGSRLLAFFRGLAPTLGTRGGAFTHHNQSLNDLMSFAGGKSFWDRNGDFAGFTNAVTVIMTAVANMRKAHVGQGAIMAKLTSAFGSAGTVAAAAFGSQTSLDQWLRVQHMISGGGIESTNKMQADIAKTTSSQLVILHTNLQNIAMLIAYQLLPRLNDFLHFLTGLTAQIATFASQHQTITAVIAYLTLFLTIVALVAGPVLMVVGALQIFAAVLGVGVGAALAGLVAAALPIIGIVAGVIVVIGALVWVFTHLSEIGTMIKQSITGVIGALLDFLGTIGLIHRKVKPNYVPGTNGSQAYNGQGHKMREIIGPGREIHWVPVPTGSTPPPAGNTGGRRHRGGGGGANPDYYYHIEIHGADHETATKLADHIVKRVEEHNAGTAARARSRAVYSPKLIPAY